MHRCAPQQVAMLFLGNHIIVMVNKNEFSVVNTLFGSLNHFAQNAL